MRAAPLDTSGVSQHVGFSKSFRDIYRRHARLALGEGAGLVDDEDVDAGELFERLGVLDQDASVRAASAADHDRHRRRQTKRTRARDDQDGDGAEQRMREAWLRPPDAPGDERDDSG